MTLVSRLAVGSTSGTKEHTVRADIIPGGTFPEIVIFPIISLQLLRSSANGPERDPGAGARSLAA